MSSFNQLLLKDLQENLSGAYACGLLHASRGVTSHLPRDHLAGSLAQGMQVLGTIWERAVYNICKHFFGVFVFCLPAPSSHAQ